MDPGRRERDAPPVGSGLSILADSGQPRGSAGGSPAMKRDAACLADEYRRRRAMSWLGIVSPRGLRSLLAERRSDALVVLCMLPRLFLHAW